MEPFIARTSPGQIRRADRERACFKLTQKPISNGALIGRAAEKASDTFPNGLRYTRGIHNAPSARLRYYRGA